MKVPSLKGEQMITILYLIGIVVILFVIYKVLAKVGIVTTQAEKKLEIAKTEAVETLRTSKYFDPLLLKSYPSYKGLGATVANRAANDLHKAINYVFGTNEEAIYTVFGQLKNKLNISDIALHYKVAYNSDLRTDLLNDLSDDESNTLVSIINKLPNS
jgi:hypothetical protein